MKKLLLAILLAISVNSFATDVSWTEIIKTGKRTPTPIVIGQDGNTIYVVRYEYKNKPILSTYKTTNLKSIQNTPLNLKFKEKKLNLLGGYMVNNMPVLATSQYNKEEKKLSYFVHKINSSLKVGKAILIGSVPIFGGSKGLSFLVGGPKGTSGIFNVSEDGNNLFCLFYQGDKKNSTKKNKSIFLDEELTRIAEADITFPYLPAEFKVISKKLGNDGRFYILGYNVLTKKGKGILRPMQIVRDNIWLYGFDAENGDLEQVKVETEVDIEQMAMKISPKGTIFITALTAKEGEGMTGSLCIVYDNQLNELNRTITPFEKDFITQTYSQKELKKQEKSEKKAKKKGEETPKAQLYNYDMSTVVESDNGSFTVFAEQYYVIVTTTSRTDPNTGVTTYTHTYNYYYNDIIAVKYDRDGQYKWKTVIEKRQYSRNDGGFYSSFFPIANGEDIGLIFNTKEIENLNIDELSSKEKRTAKRKTVCMNVTLSNDGNVSKQELFSFDESEKLAIAPKFSSQTSSGDVVIYAKSRRGYKIGVIQL